MQGPRKLRSGPWPTCVLRVVQDLLLSDGGSLRPGTPILSAAGLFSAASSRYPSGGGIGAIIGPCIEGNRRAWGSPTNSVDDDFE